MGSFGEPHRPCLNRGRPASTLRDKYRQELAHVDRQLEQVIKTLRDTGQIDNTIVILVADHGEEFGDHGRQGSHGRTLYTEVTHVPFAIRIPGVAGRLLSSPTSLTYLFPWLFSRGNAAMRALAERRLREDFGPMLEATQGAVVLELIDSLNSKVALIYSQFKTNFDARSGLLEIYDLTQDPAERRNLAGPQHELRSTMRARIDRYQQVVSCRGRIEVTTRRSQPPR